MAVDDEYIEEPCWPTVNRAALVLKLKKPFLDWLTYMSEEHDKLDHKLKAGDIETEGFDNKTVYLIPAFEDNDKFDNFLKKNWESIFVEQLGGWYTDPKMWPQDLSWKLFKEWFDYEIQTMVFDTIPDEPLEHED